MLAEASELSRSRLKTLILAGAVTVGQRTIRDPGHRVNAGDAISVTIPPDAPAEPQGEDIPLTIVHEDDSLIVIDKPKGLVVHPAAGNQSGTLVNALIAHCGASLSGIGGVKRPGIVHRLDKDTTGLMVVAKTDQAHRELSAQFADHGRTGDLEREYLAFVWGAPDRPKGSIDAPLGRHPHAREKQAIRPDGRAAVTHWELVEKYPGTDGKPVASLLACRLETGRTHQIRVHLAIWAIRCSATTPMAQVSRPRRFTWPKTPAERSRPLADRPCTPIYWASNTPKPATSCVSSPACRTTFRACGIPSQGCASRPQGAPKVERIQAFGPRSRPKSQCHQGVVTTPYLSFAPTSRVCLLQLRSSFAVAHVRPVPAPGEG